MLEVRGPSLTLRLPAPRDIAALHALASDPEVTRWFSWGPYRSEDEPRAWVEQADARRERGERLELVVERDGEVAGVTTLMEHSRRDRRAMVGTWLGRAHWGTGVNAASKALILHLAFRTMALHRVGAYANVHHERSQRALERLGFRREGVLRAWHLHPDGFHDVVVFGLLAGEWAGAEGVEVRGELPEPFRPAWTPS